METQVDAASVASPSMTSSPKSLEEVRGNMIGSPSYPSPDRVPLTQPEEDRLLVSCVYVSVSEPLLMKTHLLGCCAGSSFGRRTGASLDYP